MIFWLKEIKEPPKIDGRVSKIRFWTTPIIAYFCHDRQAIAEHCVAAFRTEMGVPRSLQSHTRRVHLRARFACGARWKKETNWGARSGRRAAKIRRGPTPGRRASLLQMGWICYSAMMTSSGTATTLVSDLFFATAARTHACDALFTCANFVVPRECLQMGYFWPRALTEWQNIFAPHFVTLRLPLIHGWVLRFFEWCGTTSFSSQIDPES